MREYAKENKCINCGENIIANNKITKVDKKYCKRQCMYNYAAKKRTYERKEFETKLKTIKNYLPHIFKNNAINLEELIKLKLLHGRQD